MSLLEIYTDLAAVERELIGGMLRNPEAITQVSFLVSGSDFTQDDLGKLFDLMVNMREAGQDPGLNLPVLEEQARSVRIVLTGGYLYKIFSETAGTVPDACAKIIREKSTQRKIESIVLSAHEETRLGKTPSGDLIETTIAQLEQLRTRNDSSFESIFDATDRLIESLEKPVADSPSIAMGIYEVDKIVGRFMGGEVQVIAARPGMGKTALAFQICQHNVSKDRPALFVSLEMRGEELALRSLAQWGLINSRDARSRSLTVQQMTRLKEHRQMLQDRKLFIWAPPTATIGKIGAVARLCKAKHKLGMVVVDYLQLVRGSNPRDDNRTQILEVSRSLKALAKELNCPVIALAQLNRQADDQEPMLKHLAECSAIEQDADVVMMLGEDRLIVAKNRHGQTGSIPVVFKKERSLFHSTGMELEPDSPAEVIGYRWP